MPANIEKPWVLVIFALVAIHAFYAFLASIGAVTGLTSITTELGTATWMFLLAMDLLILYGLYEGHAWSWWLLLFTGILGVLRGIANMILGSIQPIGVVYFLGCILLLLALTKKETLEEYKPNTAFIEGW